MGLPFFSVVSLLVRAFYSLKNTKAPVRVATIDFLINLVLSLLLMRWFGAAGLVIASTCAIIAQTLLLHRELHRVLPQLTLAPLASSFWKIGVAAVAMGIVVLVGLQVAGRLPLAGKMRDFVTIVGLIPLAMAVYGGLLWVLKIEGREELTQILARLRGKPRAA